MSSNVVILPEPKMQFGQYFEHEDIKTGLSEYGPFGLNIEGLHPHEIKLGFIGTRESIDGAKQWVEECSQPIETSRTKSAPPASILTEPLLPHILIPNQISSRVDKILNPDFMGFNQNGPFNCRFATNMRWDRELRPRDIKKILDINPKRERIEALVKLLHEEIKSLASTSPSPTVAIIALTPEMFTKAHSCPASGQFHYNLRRALKARAMQENLPIQLLRRSTVEGKGRDIQDKSTRAWNFCSALYYKADGVLWRPATMEANVCFIGVSFYIAPTDEKRTIMRASVAQAFDLLGQGVVLRGDPFEWDNEKLGKSPHLTTLQARTLIEQTLREYMQVAKVSPKRVVLHKTSQFWDSSHAEYNELDGFLEGIDAVFPHCDSDLVTIQQTGFRMFREGKYPPLRGMYLTLDDQAHFLSTMGFIPYLHTYPGGYVPEPWQITDKHGGSSHRQIFEELLTLTKMNVNNCAFADGEPITLKFAKRIGEIMKHISDNEKANAKYKFYM